MRLSMTILFFALMGISGVAITTQPIKLTGTFSDMKYTQDAGDVVGHELRIVFTRVGYEGAYQVSEGEPSELMLVKITFEGKDRVNFSVSTGAYAGSFSGTISAKGISGVFKYTTGAEERLDLPRRPSYWGA